MAKLSKPTKGQPPKQTTTNLQPAEDVALNFKVSPDFKQKFKVYASEHNMSMKEVLERAFNEYTKNS